MAYIERHRNFHISQLLLQVFFVAVATAGQGMIPMFIVTTACMAASALHVAVATGKKQREVF